MKAESKLLSQKLSDLRVSVETDVSNAATLYNRKVYELNLVSKKLQSLQTAYDSLVPYAKRVASTIPSSSSTTAAPLLNTSSSTSVALGVSALQAQLRDAHSRNEYLQQMLDEAKGENVAMRSQYLNRVEERRDETQALLKNYGQRDRLRTRVASLRLVARRVLYSLHTLPLRKAFMKWVGHSSNNQLSSSYEQNYHINLLNIENEKLGHELRREQATNRSLEGRLQSLGSPQKMPPKEKEDMRVIGVKMELDRMRKKYQNVVLENQSLKIQEERAREAEDILRLQLLNTSRGLNYGYNHVGDVDRSTDAHRTINRNVSNSADNDTRGSRPPTSTYSSYASNDGSPTRVHARLPARLPVKGPPTSDNRSPPPRRTSPKSSSRTSPKSPRRTSPKSSSRNFLGFGVRRLEESNVEFTNISNSNINNNGFANDNNYSKGGNNKSSTSFKRGSFFGTYRGTGGRKEENKQDDISWSRSNKDVLERVHLQQQNGFRGKERRNYMF